MPVSITKNQSGRYTVKTPNMTHAKGTTKEKAEKQKRLLLAIEHGFRPKGRSLKRYT